MKRNKPTAELWTVLNAATEPTLVTCGRTSDIATQCTYLLAIWSGAAVEAWLAIKSSWQRWTIQTVRFAMLQKFC